MIKLRDRYESRLTMIVIEHMALSDLWQLDWRTVVPRPFATSVGRELLSALAEIDLICLNDVVFLHLILGLITLP